MPLSTKVLTGGKAAHIYCDRCTLITEVGVFQQGIECILLAATHIHGVPINVSMIATSNLVLAKEIPS